MKKSKLALLLLLGVLIGAPIWVGLSTIAADISASNWSQTDASNTSTPPDGAPEGMAPSTVNNTMRAMMGAIKRFWDRANATVTSTGSSGIYALSYTVAPSTYVNGETFSFRANHTNGSTGATLNISSLGARTLVKPSTNGLIAVGASDIASGNHVTVQYDSTADQFAVVSGLPTSSSTLSAGDGISISGSTVSLGVNTLTTLSAPATNDDLPIYDTSVAAHRRINLVDLLSIVNSLTEETSVQPATDFVPMYDVSAGAIRKVKPQNLASFVVSATTFTASGTYTAPASLQYALVFTTGGGGGGGVGGNGVGAGGGGGGQAGGTAIGLLTAGTIGTSQSVTIGAGGGSASAGNNTTFGSILTGNGGAAGSAAAGTAGGVGGTGSGTASGGTLNLTGGNGVTAGSGNTTDNILSNGATGGSSFWGGGGAGGSTNGTDGAAYGSGGGGSRNNGTGGSGANGVVLIIEFKSS